MASGGSFLLNYLQHCLTTQVGEIVKIYIKLQTHGLNYHKARDCCSFLIHNKVFLKNIKPEFTKQYIYINSFFTFSPYHTGPERERTGVVHAP